MSHLSIEMCFIGWQTPDVRRMCNECDIAAQSIWRQSLMPPHWKTKHTFSVVLTLRHPYEKGVKTTMPFLIVKLTHDDRMKAGDRCIFTVYLWRMKFMKPYKTYWPTQPTELILWKYVRNWISSNLMLILISGTSAYLNGVISIDYLLYQHCTNKRGCIIDKKEYVANQ